MKSGKLQINELATILNEHFQWNKARMDCFVGMLVALMGVSTVNLTQLALIFPSRGQVPSRYRRMQRFFSECWIDYNDVARFIMRLFGFTDTDFYLTLNRTNWKWGKVNVNLLVLAVVYRGAAIPVYWLPPDKRGNSNSRERIALMQRFIGQFGKGRVKGLLADREFIGDLFTENGLRPQQIEIQNFFPEIVPNIKRYLSYYPNDYLIQFFRLAQNVKGENLLYLDLLYTEIDNLRKRHPVDLCDCVWGINRQNEIAKFLPGQPKYFGEFMCPYEFAIYGMSERWLNLFSDIKYFSLDGDPSYENMDFYTFSGRRAVYTEIANEIGTSI